MPKVVFFVLLSALSFIDAKAVEVEIGGLLLDNTISRQGKEFYFTFSQLWQDLPKFSGH